MHRARPFDGLAERGEQFGFRCCQNASKPGKRGGGRQHHAHLVPQAGKRVAEGVDRRARCRRKPLRNAEQHTRSPERQEGIARRNGAESDRAGCVIAGPTGDHHAGCHAPTLSEVGRENRAHVAALDQPRHVMEIEPRRLQDRLGPAAPANVEPERSGRIRHVLDHLAGQSVAYIGLGQQNLG